MSWFDTAGFASLAKSALNTAQKTIDKALDIRDERTSGLDKTCQQNKEDDSFFAAFGLGSKDDSSIHKKLTTTSSSSHLSTTSSNVPVKDSSSFWGDTWGSFFETAGSSVKMEFAPTILSSDNCGNNDHSVILPNPSLPSGAAVLSQPHQAAFFPTDDADSSLSNVDNFKNDVTIECTLEKNASLSRTDSALLKSHNEGAFSVDGDSNASLLIADITSQVIGNSKDLKINDPKKDDLDEVLLEPLCSNFVEQHSSEEGSNKYNQELHKENYLHVKKTQTASSVTDVDTELLDDSISRVEHVNRNIGKQPTLGEDKEINLITLNSNKRNSHTSQSYENVGSDFCVVESNVNPSTSEDFLQKSIELIESPSEHEVLKNCLEIERSSNISDMEGSIEGWGWNSLQQDVLKSASLSSQVNCTSHDNFPCGSISNLENHLPFSDNDKENFSSPDSIIQISDGQNISSPQHLVPSLELGVMINLSLAQMGGSMNSTLSGEKWINDGSTGFCSEEFIHEETLSESPEINQSIRHKDEEDTETPEVRECEIKSSDSGGSQGTSSSSSFVKCSVEEADSSFSHRDQSPVSATASERSDTTKFESEQNSGHTSGDENETATSSDIEIISPPNGENGDRQTTSPLKHIWIPKPHRSRRSESPASDCSKDSLMPVVREVEEDSDHSLNVRIYASCPRTTSSETDVKELLKSSQHSEYEKLLQRQNEIQEILEARERRVLELSKDNAKLSETNAKFQSQIKEMETSHAKESQGVLDLTQEFTQRLANLESKFHQACKERDDLSKQLHVAQQQVVSRLSFTEVENVIKEKDQQILELKEEGEKLSKKELHHTTIIKRLRMKEEETDNILKSQKEKLEEQSKELERLRRSLGAKDEQEKKHIDAIRQLTSAMQAQENEIANLKSDIEDANEKSRSLKKALDGSYKEITEMHKTVAEKESHAQEYALSVQMTAKEELRQGIEQAQKEALIEKEMLLAQLEDLKSSLTKLEDQSNKREEMLHCDIANLQQRLQEAEGRNEELTGNVSAATRPLLRQIENLQATFSAQSSAWEKVEKNLTDRLSDTQAQLSVTVERERATKEKCLELNSQVMALETQKSSLLQDKSRLTSQLEMMQMKITVLEESKKGEHLSVESVKQTLVEEINHLKQDKEALTLQFQLNQDQLDMEKQKVQELQEQLKQERKILTAENSSNPSPTVSRMSSVSEGMNWLQDDHPEPCLGLSTANYNRPSLYNSIRSGNTATLLEGLQSQLKLREGEISQLHSEISQLERVKESMAQELVTLTRQIDELEQELEKLRQTKESFKDMEQKYNTLLQMYGEKVEEAEELRLDLDDVKSLYKIQIEELLRKP